MGSVTAYTGERVEQCPCDDCVNKHFCIDRNLACRAAVHWITYGRYMDPDGMIPLPGYVEVIDADTASETSSAFNKTYAQEKRIKKMMEQDNDRSI